MLACCIVPSLRRVSCPLLTGRGQQLDHLFRKHCETAGWINSLQLVAVAHLILCTYRPIAYYAPGGQGLGVGHTLLRLPRFGYD